MPMAGAGSRFFKNGYVQPKPLIEIKGKPFFYWATQSLVKFLDVESLTFAVLQQHIDDFEIDTKLLEYYPNARIEVIEELLPGAVLTCMRGIKNINNNYPVIFNDCDHMFRCNDFSNILNSDDALQFKGALLTFHSNLPQFSYVKYDEQKNIIGTIEKQVVSNHAICGAYMFDSVDTFVEMSELYLKSCNYSEYFMSGVYNVMCSKGMNISDFLVDFHVPFGTPEEYKEALTSNFFDILDEAKNDE